MDKLRCMQMFVEITNSGSFTSAANHLGVSKASVTKHIAWLEKTLGAQLLHRTTQQVRLTDAGITALESARQLLDCYDGLEADIRDTARNPRGVLRVGTPPALGTHHLVPLIMSFSAAHPDIQIVLLRDDGVSNLVKQGLDLSIRVVPPSENAGYVAVALMKAPQMLVASPAYLKRKGKPETPADLVHHNCLIHSAVVPTGIWHFEGPDGPTSVRVRGSLQSDLGEPLQHAALRGHGISMHPYYMVSQDIESHRLLRVLPEFTPRGFDISVVYPTRRNLTLRARKFLDHLKDWAKTPPHWTTLPGALASSARRRAAA
jgi:DNA-binding transcriptional LysR family regulator